MVSIIVPVYNVEEYLEECVDSILAQTLRDIEVILVDDGSTDASPRICDDYGKKDSRVRVIHKANGGSTSARNQGLSIAKGEYVGFVDSDDWIDADMYESLHTAIQKSGAEVVISLKYLTHKASEYQEELPIKEGLYEEADLDMILKNLIYREDFTKRGITPNLCDKLFKKEPFLKYQLSVDERTRYGEDDVCVYSFIVNAKKIYVLNRAFYHYRMREGSVCHSADDTYFERINLFYRQLKSEFIRHRRADTLMDQLNRYMLEFVVRGINSYFGFGYGVVMPFYQPPFKLIAEHKINRLILYGAGQVGQDYFRALRMSAIVEITAWVDRQYRDYRKKGLDVCDVGAIGEKEYDAVLIAVESEELAHRISGELGKMGVEDSKIIYKTPGKLISGLEAGME